jgi:catechol 2,3-dioxygenase-like lactoylglutathione lyase family enzyme
VPTRRLTQPVHLNAIHHSFDGRAMGILAISHLTFIVRDLERTARLFVEGLGATEVYDSAGQNFSLSREKFFLLGGVWLAFMEGEPVERSYRHVAFEVEEAHLPEYETRLRALGVEIKPPRPRVEGEGLSLYFHDDDNNLFELHAGTLAQRLARYAPSGASPRRGVAWVVERPASSVPTRPQHHPAHHLPILQMLQRRLRLVQRPHLDRQGRQLAGLRQREQRLQLPQVAHVRARIAQCAHRHRRCRDVDLAAEQPMACSSLGWGGGPRVA